MLAEVKVGAYLLEKCTPRAGKMEILKALPDEARIGVGVVNQKHPHAEDVSEIAARIDHAVEFVGSAAS